MKKLLPLALAITIAASLTLSVPAQTPKATAVTIAGPSYTRMTRSDDAKIASRFYYIMAASSESIERPDYKYNIGGIQLDFQNQATTTSIIYKYDGQLYHADRNNKTAKKLNSERFCALIDEMSKDFYTLRDIPTARLDGKDLAITDSRYEYEKLDGKFYKTPFDTQRPWRISSDGKVPMPSFSMQTESVYVEIYAAAQQEFVYSGSLSGLSSFKPSKSDIYMVKYTANYSQAHARGKVTYEYYMVYDNSVAFSVDGSSTNPGEVVILRAKNVPDGSEITVKTDIQFTPKFFKQENGDRIALLPVSYYTAPGKHYVTLSCGSVTDKFEITAGDKTFSVQHLTVPPATAQETINSQKANDEYEKYIAPIRPVSDNKQYWSGRFIWPLKVPLRVTTAFGAIRYTNGGSTPSRHGAIDFAAVAGTPVYASGAGRVAYSGYLQLTGHTIVIEHGYGLKTWHYHMNGRNVETNDMVKQGQQIGVVGSTGFSTGAHLHFGMSVNNVFVNPETAVTTDLFN